MPFKVETLENPAMAHVRTDRYDEHLRYLQEHRHLLLAAGAKLSDDGDQALGSLYILDVETRQEAVSFIEAEPFFMGGLFQEVDIQRWRKAYLDQVCYL